TQSNTMKLTLGDKEHFKGIGQMKYQGPKTDNPLAFRYYDASRKLGKKTMEEHFRFAVAYWHTFCGTGGDPFGPGTTAFPWSESSDAMQRAYDTMGAGCEVITKVGAPFYCFHHYDLLDEGPTLKESEECLQK